MATFSLEQALSFDDVLLVPQKGILISRADADISTEIMGHKLDIPILSAPMSSVTESLMAIAMRNSGALGVLHRFYRTTDEQFEDWKRVSLSESIVCLGISQKSYALYSQFYQFGCKHFCIDVAHAHSAEVAAFILCLPFRDNVKLMVGNVATYQGARFLADLDVDTIKVGIGPGAACTTREVTGFGVPQLTAIMDVAEGVKDSGEEVSIIADGGIRNSGDIVKALAAGADAVMLGRLLAGADESPFPGVYFGMASKRVNGHHAPEGVEGTVPLTGPVEKTIKELAWGIKSGISYAGVTNIQELKEQAEFQIVTSLSMSETHARI